MDTYYSKQTGGFYTSVLHGNNMPDDVVKITHEEYQSLLEGQSSGKRIEASETGRPILSQQKVASVADRRLSTCTAIDNAAGAARTRFATNSAFIETEYQRAYDTAVQWINSGYQGEAPKPVKSDAEAFGRTEQDAAQTIKATGDYWFSQLDEIRNIRLKGKQAVENAPDDADFMAIAQPFVEQLEALNPDG
ncbi:hypothetical protein EZMO1_1454 [Endozoicomonas montiporae CL-33]|uniref:Uncharacterized protein n=1 Tax=Endozoicomonas montiporae CL-33 TaxID=570277 RepID=A0A142BA49_9GAMM|nr:hypothetical protein [Endozoicomonas montiporae]AMO55625.1 hypothetical protein EZMO1_1454 [Endozoicomonas montiporae CL-33]